MPLCPRPNCNSKMTRGVRLARKYMNGECAYIANISNLAVQIAWKCPNCGHTTTDDHAGVSMLVKDFK